MNRFYPPLIKQYGVRAMIGKGGFLQDTVDAMKQLGGVYLAIVGGAAAIETMQIEEIEEVWWEDLMPECLWKFRVKSFGPLIVAIDAHGNSLYKTIKDQAAERLKAMSF
jgi:L(+)-tartrate dehydratase beta subunit